jgi:hypothetical protein
VWNVKCARAHPLSPDSGYPSWGNQGFLALTPAQAPETLHAIWCSVQHRLECMHPTIFQIVLYAHFYWLVISVQCWDSPKILQVQFLTLLGSGVPPPVYRLHIIMMLGILCDGQWFHLLRVWWFRGLCAVMEEGANAKKPWYLQDAVYRLSCRAWHKLRHLRPMAAVPSLTGVGAHKLIL